MYPRNFTPALHAVAGSLACADLLTSLGAAFRFKDGAVVAHTTLLPNATALKLKLAVEVLPALGRSIKPTRFEAASVRHVGPDDKRLLTQLQSHARSSVALGMQPLIKLVRDVPYYNVCVAHCGGRMLRTVSAPWG